MRRFGIWLFGLVGGARPAPARDVRLTLGHAYGLYSLLMFLEWTPALRCPYCGGALADAVKHAADCKLDRQIKLLAVLVGDQAGILGSEDVTPTRRAPLP